MPAWRAPLAWAYARPPRGGPPRAGQLCRDDFAALPRDVNFDTVLGILAHVAEALADAGLAAQIEPYLRPVSNCSILFGIGSATLGPVAYSLGVCSLLTGKLDVAVSDFELALRLSRRMRARPYEAHAALGLARALAERDGPGDAERATASRRAALCHRRRTGHASPAPPRRRYGVAARARRDSSTATSTWSCTRPRE